MTLSSTVQPEIEQEGFVTAAEKGGYIGQGITATVSSAVPSC